MSMTTIGLFRQLDEARGANIALESAGFMDVVYFTRETHNEAELTQELKTANVPHSIEAIYQRGLDAGGALLMIHTSEVDAPQVRAIIEQHTIQTDSESFHIP